MCRFFSANSFFSISIILGDLGFQEGGLPHGLRFLVGSNTVSASAEFDMLGDKIGRCLFGVCTMTFACSYSGASTDSAFAEKCSPGDGFSEGCTDFGDAGIDGEGSSLIVDSPWGRRVISPDFEGDSFAVVDRAVNALAGVLAGD